MMIKMIPSVFLALCLGIMPTFSQDVTTPAEAGAAVVKTEPAETTAGASAKQAAVKSAVPRKPADGAGNISSAQAVLDEAVDRDAAAMPAVSDINSAPAAPAAEPLSFGDESSQFSMLRAVGGMGLVLCLLAAAYFGVRKFAPGFFPKPSGGKDLKIVETLNMGERRSLLIVEAGGNRLLLGSTPQQINLLTAFTEHFPMISEGVDAREGDEKRSFRNLFEVEKKRPVQYSGNMLPEEIRQKMRRLREALDR